MNQCLWLNTPLFSESHSTEELLYCLLLFTASMQMCSILFVSAARIFVGFLSRLQNNPLFTNLGHSHKFLTIYQMNIHSKLGFTVREM